MFCFHASKMAGKSNVSNGVFLSEMSRDLLSSVTHNGEDINSVKVDLSEQCQITELQMIHIEIRQSVKSTLNNEKIVSLAKEVIPKTLVVNNTSTYLIPNSTFSEETRTEIDSIAIYMPISSKEAALSLTDANTDYHIYTFASEVPENLDLGLDNLDVDAATYWCLPTSDFDGLWESLIFETDIKSKLLRYINSTLLFLEKKVSSSILPWNKVIFLHGPPGTGKTSLCKALAQKICIRFASKYSSGYFVEIHSHNLFSKWFSESGKFVTKLFEAIMAMVEDEKSLVILLIDEVETLAHCRKASLQGQNEPSDGIRVVNALLTHLDKIKRYPNVLVMTTSNITEAVDMALVDRADVKQFIGLPCAEAIYTIYVSCIQELQKTGIIEEEIGSQHLNDLHSIESQKLKTISKQSVGLSGRTIRKLPLIAHALYFETLNIPLNKFLEALHLAVDQQFEDRKSLVD